MFNLEQFKDLQARAEWMADNVGTDPRELMYGVNESVAAYAENHGIDRLPEELCGPVCAVSAAIVVYALATDALDGGEAMAALQDGLWNANHAVEHGDPLALDVFTPREGDGDAIAIDELAGRLSEWVVAHLPTSDPDAFLASLSVGGESDVA